MPKKALKCIVDVKVHMISCPGVWLCSKAEAYLTIAMFGLEYHSKLMTPIFPLFVYEKYRFEKSFEFCSDPAEVARALEEEGVYFELIQLTPDRRHENVLATYHTSVRNFLFPNPIMRPRYSSSEKEVLMNVTGHFPGVISPKLEFCTSTVLKESGFVKPRVPERSPICQEPCLSPRMTKYMGCSSPLRVATEDFPSSPRTLPPCPVSDDEFYETNCVVCRLYKKYFGRKYLGHNHGMIARSESLNALISPCESPGRSSSDSTLDVIDRGSPPLSSDEGYMRVPKWYYRYLLNEALEKNYHDLYNKAKSSRWS